MWADNIRTPVNASRGKGVFLVYVTLHDTVEHVLMRTAGSPWQQCNSSINLPHLPIVLESICG